jgi:hypothetical protein
MTHFNSGVSGITNNSKGLFKYSISTIEVLMNKQVAKGSSLTRDFAKKNVAIFGKELEDIISLLRLQKQMVEYSSAFYRLVIPAHYEEASEVLSQLKNVGNVKL